MKTFVTYVSSDAVSSSLTVIARETGTQTHNRTVSVPAAFCPCLSAYLWLWLCLWLQALALRALPVCGSDRSSCPSLYAVSLFALTLSVALLPLSLRLSPPLSLRL